MQRPTKISIAGLMDEYDNWKFLRAPLSALVSLGKVMRVAPPGERAALHSEIRKRIDETQVADARVEARAALQRARHILSIGSNFDQDELLLVLTLRQQVELACEVVRLFGVSPTTSSCRRSMQTSAASPGHRRTVERSSGHFLAFSEIRSLQFLMCGRVTSDPIERVRDEH
jgi:hypothetical protein